MNKSVKTFDGLDHQYIDAEDLHQIDAHMIFNKGEQLRILAAHNQWHNPKMAYVKFSSSVIALGWFLQLYESHKNDWFAFVSALKENIFLQRKLHMTHRVTLRL